MTTDEKDYSDYIKHMSSFSSVISVFAGFTFSPYLAYYSASRPKQYQGTGDIARASSQCDV